MSKDAEVETERANEEDVAARAADFNGLMTLLYLRHGAMMTAPNPSERRAVYYSARESARRELEWRFVDRVPDKAALAEKALDEGRCQSCGTECHVVVDRESNITYEPVAAGTGEER